jgi:hypothetical protein
MRWYIVDFTSEPDVAAGRDRASAGTWATVLDYRAALEAVVPLGKGSFLVPPEEVPPFDGTVDLEIAHQLGVQNDPLALQFIGILVGFLGEPLCRDLVRKARDRVHPDLVRRADGSPRTAGGIFFQTVEREIPNNTGAGSLRFG